MTATSLSPFLKWAGGKRWLIPELKHRIPSEYDSYYEPFLGGGAIFFSLCPKRGFLADVNENLVELYCVVRDQPADLVDVMLDHQHKHCKDYYYYMRAFTPATPLLRAARLLYLNRTCFNGLYRVNRRGQFNVPIGSKTTVVFENETFENISSALQNIVLCAQDFEKTLQAVGANDLVYVDPPYTVAHNLNGFLKYNDNIFSWNDQIRLRNTLEDAALRGARILISNANHDSIRSLYHGFGNLTEIRRFSVIAGPSANRVLTSELLITVGLNE